MLLNWLPNSFLEQPVHKENNHSLSYFKLSTSFIYTLNFLVLKRKKTIDTVFVKYVYNKIWLLFNLIIHMASRWYWNSLFYTILRIFDRNPRCNQKKFRYQRWQRVATFLCVFNLNLGLPLFLSMKCLWKFMHHWKIKKICVFGTIGDSDMDKTNVDFSVRVRINVGAFFHFRTKYCSCWSVWVFFWVSNLCRKKSL